MAFYGSLGEVNFDNLDASIADTAVDVFVYDTSKDSDGGAWRHRTQHTSWYNETLNTATRGSRREFPAVAVITVQNAGTNTVPMITIYDGDDPDLPMWMVFRNHISGGGNDQTLSTTYYAAGPYQTRKVAMLNGIMVDCQYRTSGHVGGVVKGVTRFNFIDDSSTMMTDEGDFKRNGNLGDERNTIKSYTKISTTTIVQTQCNDVAMTVLPNAPIDSATGLPIPTIAVATDGGTSIIKDDGTVSDLRRGSGSFTNSVQFTDDNSIMLVWGHASDAIRHINHYSYGDWQTDKTDYDQVTGYHELPQFGASALHSPLRTSATGIISGVLVNLNGQNRMSAKWDNYGLKLADLNDSSRANGMVAHIRPEYNSGWMHGDIKGAFLSDTDTTNVTSNELVPNSEFLSNVGWEPFAQSGYSISGGLLVDGSSSNSGEIDSPSFYLSTGTHTLSYQITGSGGLPTLTVDSTDGVTTIETFQTPDNPSNGVYSTTFNVTTAGNYIVAIDGGGFVGSFDYISIIAGTGTRTYTSEADRSVNNKPLDVHGTVTKSAVATGADLVGYGNFNSGNYLLQPYNSALDFGTGDFCYMCWVKDDSVGVAGVIFQRGAEVNNNETVLYIDSSFRLIGRVSTSGNGLQSDACFVQGSWNHCVFLRSGTTIQIYHNGKLVGSKTNTESMNQSGYGLSIGAWLTNNSYFPTSISLFRVSASVPSPEQIKKIYEDEKVLFQENAACTLYGSSDAVTALAYDEDTDLLHVGTSSGRSDFQGLRRINNTTTAVTTAISASDGLIVEQ